MKKTKIEWCDSTWNPVTGCLHGCEYCYARRIAERFGGNITGVETVKRITIADGRMIWDLLKPIYKTDGKISPYPCGFIPTFHRYRLDEPQRWTKSRNVFVCSMADLFGSWVPDSWIEEVFTACEKAPQHRYLFLTKNPKRYEEYGVPADDNKWYGVSVTKENDIELINSLPERCNTFLSIEPLLEDLFFENHESLLKNVDWVIIGDIPIFMKNSLMPVIGESDMLREYPWETQRKG